jgi:hypothetical protein
MRDLIALLLSVAFPWLVGALCIRAASRRPVPHATGISVGYGYLVGLFAVTLVMRALSRVSPPWSVAWIALPLAALALAAYFRIRFMQAIPGPAVSQDPLAPTSPLLRICFWSLLVLSCIRAIMLCFEVVLTPLVPYDAIAQWATKSRVWYEYGRMSSFIRPWEWSAAAGTMNFTDSHPEYPGTVPLFQVWTALCLGRWDESLINLPWVGAFVALGVAFYAQARRIGLGALEAMFATYLLLSLPFLTIHVALAGTADLFVAIAYGMAAIALWQWVYSRQWFDMGLAIVMAIICASLKLEGIFWVLTLAFGGMVALNRRLGLAIAGLAAAASLLYLAFGPSELRIFSYTLHTRFVDVSLPVYEHLFFMDNWHLLWYAVVAVLVTNWRLLLSKSLAPMSVTMLAAAGFIIVVFFFSNASGGVDDETLTNRLLLHVVPALVFYLALILRERARQPVRVGKTKPVAI